MVVAKQISSLEKVRYAEDIKNEVSEVQLFLGEHYSYQIVLEVKECTLVEINVDSQLEDYINIYSVEDSVMDLPVDDEHSDDDYITKSKGVMPDLLVPVNKHKGTVMFAGGIKSFWVEICVPENFAAGKYDVNVNIKYKPTYSKDKFDEVEELKSVLHTEIINVKLPDQNLLFTQWFHVDCIASAHNVEIYSEEHWSLIDKYMQTAAELGINMILTPVITPPLDTEVGKARPNTQLVVIKKTNDGYEFDFSLLKRWILLCNKNGIKHFEISHLFSQWGAGFAPNIYVYHDAKLVHEFGWHISSDDERYIVFLKQFLPRLIEFLKSEGIEKRCYFHISDEPTEEHLDTYRKAYELVKPLIGECKLMDALSDYVFYENGTVETPVCCTNHIEPFLKHNTENLWAYYCCMQGDKVGNRFMAMPSYRNRILGMQLYKFDIKGFLQWGYNFYYSQYSRYEINPYITSSAGGIFPSGDSFSVYPGKDGPLKSLRAIIFYEALQDISICNILEEIIGREKVVEIIDRSANMDITFSDYPRNSLFIIDTISEIKKIILRYFNEKEKI